MGLPKVGAGVSLTLLRPFPSHWFALSSLDRRAFALTCIMIYHVWLLLLGAPWTSHKEGLWCGMVEMIRVADYQSRACRDWETVLLLGSFPNSRIPDSITSFPPWSALLTFPFKSFLSSWQDIDSIILLLFVKSHSSFLVCRHSLHVCGGPHTYHTHAPSDSQMRLTERNRNEGRSMCVDMCVHTLTHRHTCIQTMLRTLRNKGKNDRAINETERV